MLGSNLIWRTFQLHCRRSHLVVIRHGSLHGSVLYDVMRVRVHIVIPAVTSTRLRQDLFAIFGTRTALCQPERINPSRRSGHVLIDLDAPGEPDGVLADEAAALRIIVPIPVIVQPRVKLSPSLQVQNRARSAEPAKMQGRPYHCYVVLAFLVDNYRTYCQSQNQCITDIFNLFLTERIKPSP